MTLTRKKPMFRSAKPMRQISAKRVLELAAAGIRSPYSTLVTGPRKAAEKRPRNTDPDEATVNAAKERDGRCCVVCSGWLRGIRGLDWSEHHRKLRSQGGTNSLDNLISVCGHGTAGCHGRIHANPKWARDNGYMVRRSDDPALKPIVHALHGVVYLTADGGWTSRRPEVPA